VRTTVNIDDDLLDTAREMTGIRENAALIRHAVEQLVEREAARRLARLGGTAPDLRIPPRQRALSESAASAEDGVASSAPD
jgi:Arc/MetJ family transcription regulator